MTFHLLPLQFLLQLCSLSLYGWFFFLLTQDHGMNLIFHLFPHFFSAPEVFFSWNKDRLRLRKYEVSLFFVFFVWYKKPNEEKIQNRQSIWVYEDEVRREEEEEEDFLCRKWRTRSRKSNWPTREKKMNRGGQVDARNTRWTAHVSKETKREREREFLLYLWRAMLFGPFYIQPKIRGNVNKFKRRRRKKEKLEKETFRWLSSHVKISVQWMAACEKVNEERCCGFPTVSLWLIESNWPRVFFALSSKTDHFVWPETSWHTLSIRFWGNSPSPHVFCGPSFFSTSLFPILSVSLSVSLSLSLTDRLSNRGKIQIK